MNGRGVFQRINVPSAIRGQINELLLSMNENNILEVNQKITELHDSVLKREEPLPDYRFHQYSLMQLQQDYYNEVIIPSLYPEVKCKVCESPMLESVFPDLFFKLDAMKNKVQADPKGNPVRTDIQLILPDFFKNVGGQTVVDTDAVDERNRRIAMRRTADAVFSGHKPGTTPDPVIDKRVDEFSAMFEAQSVTTPEEGGITVVLPYSGIELNLKAPTQEDMYASTTTTFEFLDRIGINLFGEEWKNMRTPRPVELSKTIEPVVQKTAYELWLEDGNVGEIEDYISECGRYRRSPSLYPEDFKETVKYFHKQGGHSVVIRKDNYGGYALSVYPAKTKDTCKRPEIKGVILKGSKPPIQIDDGEVRSHIKNFVEAQYEPHLAAQVLEKLDTIAEVEKKPLVAILPPHLSRIIDSLKFGKGHIEAAVAMLKDIQSNNPTVAESGEYDQVKVDTEFTTGYEAVFEEIAREEQVKVDAASTVPSLAQYDAVLEQLTWEAERRILIGTSSYGIQEQFLRFLKRCDEEQLNTATPSAYDREHFDKIYKTNRDSIGYMLATVLTPHLENAAHRREYMVDGTENNVLRVSRICHGRKGASYRPLVTIRFVKGFFNIEMH
jgi:hypothetical protein